MRHLRAANAHECIEDWYAIAKRNVNPSNVKRDLRCRVPLKIERFIRYVSQNPAFPWFSSLFLETATITCVYVAFVYALQYLFGLLRLSCSSARCQCSFAFGSVLMPYGNIRFTVVSVQNIPDRIILS